MTIKIKAFNKSTFDSKPNKYEINKAIHSDTFPVRTNYSDHQVATAIES